MKHFLYGILTGLVGVAVAGVGLILIAHGLARLARLLPP